MPGTSPVLAPPPSFFLYLGALPAQSRGARPGAFRLYLWRWSGEQLGKDHLRFRRTNRRPAVIPEVSRRYHIRLTRDSRSDLHCVLKIVDIEPSGKLKALRGRWRHEDKAGEIQEEVLGLLLPLGGRHQVKEIGRECHAT